MEILSIVGARPQFIKLAPLSEKLRHKHQETIVHTGQHYDYLMSDKIFSDLGIRPPDIHLNIGSGTHAYQTAEMMKAIELVLIERKPDLVIVFGDTNSTLAGAIATSKLNIPLLHIEAGLRSYNKHMPEEINRIATDHVSDFLFAPTPTACKNLENEGKSKGVFLTGDIMVDTLTNNLKIAEENSTVLSQYKLEPDKFHLLTLHRGYNVDNAENLEHIISQFSEVSEKIVFPVHPRTRKVLSKIGSIPTNLLLTEPLGYLDFIKLENSCLKIITDSGGIQKEAYIMKKPCITLRTETEWVETVEEGWNLLLSPQDKYISKKITGFTPPKKQANIFGENVADKMVETIESF